MMCCIHMHDTCAGTLNVTLEQEYKSTLKWLSYMYSQLKKFSETWKWVTLILWRHWCRQLGGKLSVELNTPNNVFHQLSHSGTHQSSHKSLRQIYQFREIFELIVHVCICVCAVTYKAVNLEPSVSSFVNANSRTGKECRGFIYHMRGNKLLLKPRNKLWLP